jgi:hypothetical protein
MKQKLLTKEILSKLPKLYAQDGKGPNQVAYVKFFYAYGSGEWFATEFDGKDTFFGWAQNIGGNRGEGELCYFSLSELQAIRARGFGGRTLQGIQGIERDTSFRPARLCDIKGIVGLRPTWLAETEEEAAFNA